MIPLLVLGVQPLQVVAARSFSTLYCMPKLLFITVFLFVMLDELLQVVFFVSDTSLAVFYTPLKRELYLFISPDWVTRAFYHRSSSTSSTKLQCLHLLRSQHHTLK